MNCVSLNVSTIRYTVSARAKCIKNQKVGVGWRERGGRGDGFGETNYHKKKVAPGLLREVSRGKVSKSRKKNGQSKPKRR